MAGVQVCSSVLARAGAGVGLDLLPSHCVCLCLCVCGGGQKPSGCSPILLSQSPILMAEGLAAADSSAPHTNRGGGLFLVVHLRSLHLQEHQMRVESRGCSSFGLAPRVEVKQSCLLQHQWRVGCCRLCCCRYRLAQHRL